MDRRLSLVCGSGSGRSAFCNFAIATEVLSERPADRRFRPPRGADVGAAARSCAKRDREQMTLALNRVGYKLRCGGSSARARDVIA